MIAYIKGKLVSVTDDGIVVENNQMGYEIKVPSSVMNGVPLVGNDVKIYTYLYVREDILQLYGFLTKDDLAIFKLLITVNGIGPKGALGILSVITPDELRFAILADDAKTIAKAPGIGAKTASKMILDLKDKISLSDAFSIKLANAETEQGGSAAFGDIKDEAVQALVALGYSGSEALRAVRQVEILPETTVEDILKAGLKKIQL